MTNPDELDHGASRGGVATNRGAEALRRLADTKLAVDAALPVRIIRPTDDARDDVVVHFQHDSEEGWSVFGDVTRGPQGLVISRLQISPPHGSSGVTAGLLRKIPVGEILTAVRTKAAWEAAQRAGTRAVLGQEAVPGVFAEGDEEVQRRSGRAPLAQDLLRKVAMAYIDENAPGKPSGAMKRIAEEFGKPEQTVRNWVARARRDGWLGPSVKGRTGAEAGPKLLGWVAAAMNNETDALKEAAAIAAAYEVEDLATIEAAVRAYGDIGERDLSHRMGLPPLQAAVLAQVLFGQRLSAEIARRVSVSGTSDEAAFGSVATEMRAAYEDAPTDL